MDGFEIADQNVEIEKEKILFFSDVKNIAKIMRDNHLSADISQSFIGENEVISDNLSEFISTSFWDNYRSMYRTNATICELSHYLPSDFRCLLLLRKSYSFEKALDIAEDFFHDYDMDIYNYFLFLRRNNYLYRTNLEKDHSCGLTINLYYTNKSFILIDKSTCDINLLMTIAHEVIHSYIFHLMPNISFDEDFKMRLNSLDEVYSFFAEFAFTNYLERIWGETKDITIIKNGHFNRLISRLADFSTLFNKFRHLSPDYDLSSYSLYESLAYGILMSYHYFDYYLQDPESAKDDILNLSIDSKDYDKHFLLNNYGLSEENLGDPKVIKKHI